MLTQSGKLKGLTPIETSPDHLPNSENFCDDPANTSTVSQMAFIACSPLCQTNINLTCSFKRSSGPHQAAVIEQGCDTSQQGKPNSLALAKFHSKAHTQPTLYESVRSLS